MQEKQIMEKRLETAYEEFCLTAMKSSGREGKASRDLENFIYARLGLSADDVLDMLATDDVLP